jgi:hypothetical protein
VAEELEAALVGVIRQEERDAVIPRDIAGCDVLPVAAELGVASVVSSSTCSTRV